MISYDNVKMTVENSGCALLSRNYCNIFGLLKFRCKCGREFVKSFKDFRRAPRCRDCYKKELRSNLIARNRVSYNRLSYDYIKNSIRKAGYEILSDTYTNSKMSNLRLKCPVGHEYVTSWTSFGSGKGCPMCAIINRANRCRNTVFNISSYVESFGYKLLSKSYNNEKTKIKLKCPAGHEYTTSYNAFQQGCRCPRCSSVSSKFEKDVQKWVFSLDVGIVEDHNRKVLDPYEVDIYIPKQRLGIECNGLYWHSVDTMMGKRGWSLKKAMNLHKMKAVMADSAGIRLIQIFEDEWRNRRGAVERIIKSALGKDSVTIFARKCKIEDVSYSEAKAFLENNHVGGPGSVGKIRLGLYNGEELVFLMTFSGLSISKNRKREDGVWELYKQCSSVRVTGGMSRLFKYFIDKYKPSKIISYADRRYFNANSYVKCGFVKTGVTVPNYYYVKRGERKHRFGFRKDVLIKMGYDKNMTEREITQSMGLYRIYDAGHIKLEWRSE